MKNVLLSILLLALSFSSYSYTGDTTAATSHNSWAIKGKVLPWFGIGSMRGINYTLGVEYGFAKVHSIGIDLVYNDNCSGHEVYDSVEKEYRPGPKAYTVSRGIFINYRRYLDIRKTMLYRPLVWVFNDNFLPYVSAFGRVGNRDYHYEKNYETSNISHDELQYSAGILFGVVSGVFDINAGPFYKRKDMKDVDVVNGNVVRSSGTEYNFGFRVGVNIYLVAKMDSDHYLNRYASHAQ